MDTQRFITFEGGEGAGKTTQLHHLAEALRATGEVVTVTREPGGSPPGEALRRLLLDQGEDWSPLGEALLHNAARAEHLHQTITPALARGEWVLCDRFADSTRAYQGAGLGLEDAALASLEHLVVGPAWPALTLILDLPPEAGLARAASRGRAVDRYESRDFAFHARLRAAFLDIARAAPDRCAVIDAAAAPETVAARVREAVRTRLDVAI